MYSQVSPDDLSRAGWYNVYQTVLETALRAKFNQSLTHQQHLLATGSQRLVFATLFDTVLGTGLSMSDPDCCEEGNWIGENRLGNTLEKVRYELVCREPSTAEHHIAAPASERKRKLNKDTADFTFKQSKV